MGSLSPIHWLILIVLLLIVVFGIRAMVRLISRSSSGPPPTAPPQTGQPRAGWYPDQQDPALVRWHDGYQWTAYTQPRQKT